MSSLCLLKGISGTGKGTRVALLQLFLINETDYEVLSTQHPEKDKTIPYGIYFPQYNIRMLGKWARSHKSKLWSWTSLDYFYSSFGREFTESTVRNSTDANTIIEGYPMTGTKIYRPDGLHTHFGYDRQMINTFVYNDFEELQQRVEGRSGKRIKGTCWGGNKTFYNECDRMLEASRANPNIFCVVLRSSYDEEVESFGVRYLTFLGLDSLINRFKEFAKSTDVFRKVGKDQDFSKNPLIEIYKNWGKDESTSR